MTAKKLPFLLLILGAPDHARSDLRYGLKFFEREIRDRRARQLRHCRTIPVDNRLLGYGYFDTPGLNDHGRPPEAAVAYGPNQDQQQCRDDSNG